MGLTCSLLGHVFDETDVEREREERGSEVVTVVRDIERCSRCGAERVVAENKEVTSVVDPEDVGLADDGGRNQEPTGSAAGDGDADEDVGGIGGLAARAGAYDDDGETLEGDSFNDDEYDPPASPEEEDAEILTDDDEPVERAPGQWPDEPEDEPWAPEPITKPAEGDEGVEVVEGSAPAERAPDPDPAPEQPDPTVEAETDLETGEGSDLTVPVGELVCDACGQRIDTESSYRAGDACPACQRGWLEAE